MTSRDKTKEILRTRVAERLSALGKTPHAVSKAIGANSGYVRDLLDPEKTSIPGADRARQLAEELETTTDWLMGKADTPEQVRSEVAFRELPLAWKAKDSDGIPVLGTGYCEDLIVDGGDGEELSIERVLLEVDHVVRMIERPAALANAKDAYAIYFHGSSMEERFYQGEIGVVDPRRPPSPGDFVVVQLTNGQTDDVVTVIVKQLERVAGGFVYLKQFKPELSFRIDRRQVKALHRICNPAELLGG